MFLRKLPLKTYWRCNSKAVSGGDGFCRQLIELHCIANTIQRGEVIYSIFFRRQKFTSDT